MFSIKLSLLCWVYEAREQEAARPGDVEYTLLYFI